MPILPRMPRWVKRLLASHMAPTQILSLGFAIVILLGATLLSLPIAARGGESIGFLDALFTATTSVCVTGLVVVDTGTTFARFGHVVILALIEIGGLGFMTMATLAFLLLGKRITLRERLVMREAMGEAGLQGVVSHTLRFVWLTLTVQALGAMLLCTRFIPIYGLADGLFYGAFHAVSAFCNAGIDLMGDYQNLVPYATDVVVNGTVMALIVVGGLGFSVVWECWRHRGLRGTSLHTKMTVLITLALIALGAVGFFLSEMNNPDTLGALPAAARPLAALFQSITTRTAGFNTIDQNAMTRVSKMMTVVLMFIGASPASTGGGVKTTTVGVILLMGYAVVRGRSTVVLNKREVRLPLILRAVTVFLIALLLVVVGVMVLCATEADNPRADLFTLENIIVEVTSAFATVGLSCGLTPHLGVAGKIAIIVIMFAGRVGPLTLTNALARRQGDERGAHVRYPEAKILV